ncbi:MAG TPA: efflux RND transporter periplasmic adaptor subunit [Gammaproteobacteria bacterium]|nr:efflux RND transporter periplasmic adaptor subunit [Gammaproteobacteria bacterium]
MSAEHTEPATVSAAAAPIVRRKRGRTVALLALLVVAVGGGYYWYRSSHQVSGDKPLVSTAVIGDVENAVASSGTLQPSNTVPVGAQVSGQLQKLHVQIGDQVEVDQLLGEIDARVQRNKVDSSRASIASAEAQIAARKEALVLAEANWERQQRLWSEQATSKQEYDSAKNNLAAAQASLTQQEQSIIQSKATLATDETLLEYTKIFAPIAGTVVSLPMKEGTTLNATQQSPTIMSIANLSTMTVETQISEADVGKVYTGMPVYFTTLGSNGRRWYSTLRQILPTATATNNVVTYTGLFDVDNSDGALLSGMTTQVYFVTSSARNVLTIPLGAVTFADAAPAARGPGEGGRRPQGAAGGGSNGAPPNGGPSAGGERPRGEDAALGGATVTNTSFPGDARRRGGAGAATGARAPAPRQGKVRVVAADGSISDREVTIGVTSRVTAEVMSGLSEGEQVVAGIAQAAAPAGGQQNNGNNNFNQFNNNNFNRGGFPGGGNFPGGGFPR